MTDAELHRIRSGTWYEPAVAWDIKSLVDEIDRLRALADVLLECVKHVHHECRILAGPSHQVIQRLQDTIIAKEGK